MTIFEARHHPEAGDDEVHLGNYGHELWLNVGWKTKRRGITPYDVNGVALTHGQARPVFVKRSEIEAAGFTITEIARS